MAVGQRPVMAIEGRVLDDLVGLIYETVSDPSNWGEVTRQLAKEVSAESYWMFRIDSGAPDFFALQNLSKSLLDTYSSEFHKHDVLMQEEIRRARDFVGRAVREEEIIGELPWQASRIYHELARPNGMHRVLSMNLSNDLVADVPFLTFFRPYGASSFQRKHLDFCDRLIPHLRRAIRLADQARTRENAVPRWTETLLDQLNAGIVLLDRHGTILFANRVSTEILNCRDGLATKGGKLVTVGGRVARELEDKIESCCRGQSLGGEISVPSGKGHWLISVCPLLRSPSTGLAGPNCRAWVWIGDPNKGSNALPGRLQLLFGLTAKEQSVAIALMDNMTPADIADLHQVSINTVRTQIQHIYGKLGIRRQLELLQLLHDIRTLPSGQP